MSDDPLTIVVDHLDATGVSVRAHSGELEVTGPVDAIAAELLDELRNLKPRLLEIACWRTGCGSVKLGSYDPQGHPLCGKHDGTTDCQLCGDHSSPRGMVLCGPCAAQVVEADTREAAHGMMP